MNYMFEGCSNLTSLDLSSFATSKVLGMYAMFRNCTNLKTIYVGDKWKLANDIRGMFAGCGTSTTTKK